MVIKKSSKKKRPAILFKLVSTAQTGYYYLVRRNPRKKPEKIERRKYDPKIGKHVLFKEQKLS